MAMGFVADTGDFNFLFEQFNRNKRGVAIDLRNDEGRAALDRLIEWADVFITNFLPSARDEAAARPRRHLGGEPALRLRDRLGPGPRGARRRPGRLRRGVVLGARRARRTCSRRRAASSCSRAARSATRRAARTSRAASRPRCSSASAPARRRSSTCRCSAPRSGRCRTTSCRRRSCGVEPPSRTRRGQELWAACSSGSFRTADERWLSLNMLDPDRHWEPTCRALGLERADRQSRATRPPRSAQHAHRRAASESSSNASRRSPLAELKERLSAQDTICSSIASPVEVIDDPQVARQRLHAARIPGIRPRRLSSSPMQFDGHGLEIHRRRARRRRAHRRGASARSASTRREIARLRATGSAGVRSPVPQPRMIWAVGLNYRDHAAETGRPLPECADAVREVAAARSSRPTTPIVVPPHVHAARLRRRARGRDRATRRATSRVDDALDVVAGVTIAHDVSARDHQYTTGQLSWSKSFDTFCPLGPEVVSLDEVDLAARARDRDARQRRGAAVVEHVGARVRRAVADRVDQPGLHARTGRRDPHRHAGRRRRRARRRPAGSSDGDVVEITIDGVGTLRNPVSDARAVGLG